MRRPRRPAQPQPDVALQEPRFLIFVLVAPLTGLAGPHSAVPMLLVMGVSATLVGVRARPVIDFCESANAVVIKW